MKPLARLSALILVAGFAMITAAPLGAQESLDLSILNEGKIPPQPVTISTVEDGEKRTLATSTDGTATIDFDLLNVGKGTPVGVHLVNCDGETEIVLLPPGEVSDECDRAREDPDCGCRRLGVIPWGETPAVTVHLENGGSLEVPDTPDVADRPGAEGQPRGGQPTTTGYRDPWRFGVGVTYASFPNLEDTGCVGAAGCEVDDSGIGGGVFLEYDIAPELPIFVGLRGGYTSTSVNQTFSSGATQDVDLSVFSAGVYGGLRLPVGDRFGWRVFGGPRWLWNDADVSFGLGTDLVTESRSESGLRFALGTGFDFPLGDRTGARIGYSFVDGDEGDADRQHEFEFGISLTF